MNLINKTIIITGCNSGLGLANLESFLHVCKMKNNNNIKYIDAELKQRK